MNPGFKRLKLVDTEHVTECKYVDAFTYDCGQFIIFLADTEIPGIEALESAEILKPDKTTTFRERYLESGDETILKINIDLSSRTAEVLVFLCYGEDCDLVKDTYEIVE